MRTSLNAQTRSSDVPADVAVLVREVAPGSLMLSANKTNERNPRIAEKPKSAAGEAAAGAHGARLPPGLAGFANSINCARKDRQVLAAVAAG